MSARILIMAYLVTTQTGCAVYVIASGISTVTTGKSASEHVISVATGADCGVKNWIDHKHYWCEQPRNAGTNYVSSLD